MRPSGPQIFGVILVLAVFILTSLAIILGSTQIQSILGGEAAALACAGGLIGLILWG